MSERSLKGKTIFITGASRGIGRAIALRAAKDGANVVIVAKTADPNPKLEGTIYSVAAEVEKAGGKALPLKVDLRNADEVANAVKATVEKFGGIDILVNNASALAIMPTLETDIKRFDLVHSINARGTWLCSRLCLPHLLKSKNPHILTLSPPLDMDPLWFKSHCAYTMAKFGMSMVVLGLSAEFKEDGVAVNALWPVTTINTAALNILGGDTVKNASRTDQIMSDAAWAILTRPSKQCTGNFFLDEDILREEGVTNFDKYAVTPGATLIPDFFVKRNIGAFQSANGVFATPTVAFEDPFSGPVPSSSASAEDFNMVTQALQGNIAKNPHIKQDHPVFVQYEVKSNPRAPALPITFDVSSSNPCPIQGKSGYKPECCISGSASDLKALVNGSLDLKDGFASGKVTVRGSLRTASRLHGSPASSKL